MPVDRSRLPAVGPDPTFQLPEIVRHTLSNGLPLRTIEHRSVPVVTFVVQIDGGSGADPSGFEGLAATTADMLDEGTGELSALEVSEALARIGADYDVDVGGDATVFTLTTLSRFASQGASLLAKVLLSPSLLEADFTRVRQLRIDRVQQLKDVPQSVAERAFLRLLYGAHPYGHLSLGDERSIASLTLEQVRAFHASTFTPERAVMIAVGALSHAELARIADDTFGGWAPAPHTLARPVDASTVEPVVESPRLVVVDRPGAAQSELRIGHLSTRRRTPDYWALIVMNAILGGQFVSRINLKLREEKGYTYGARTGFDWHRGIAPFSLHTSVHTAATADAVRDSLNEFEAIRGTRPASESEMALAKASLTRSRPLSFETAQQVAGAVSQLAFYGLPDSHLTEFVPRVKNVSVDDVTNAARQYLHPDKITTLVVGDHAAIANSLTTLGIGDVSLLESDR